MLSAEYSNTFSKPDVNKLLKDAAIEDDVPF
jgi:hypothetical protein